VSTCGAEISMPNRLVGIRERCVRYLVQPMTAENWAWDDSSQVGLPGHPEDWLDCVSCAVRQKHRSGVEDAV